MNMDKKKNGFPCVTDACVYCGLCAKKCPAGAITVNRKEKIWEMDEQKCIQCGACAVSCNKNAIEFDEKARLEALAQKKAPVSVPPSKGVLVCNEELCAGCMNCMFACTLNKDSAACLDLARIQMNTYTQAEFHIEALPCRQCTDPQCMRFCPVEAIYVDEKTGARVINEEKCIGCKTCIAVCPYEVPRVVFDTVKKKATKCDLCGGDPACVKMCPTGALKYVTSPEGLKTGYELEKEA